MIPDSVSFIKKREIPHYEAASAAFSSFLPEYFKDKVVLLNKIRTQIAAHFALEIHNVHICGSAQFGHSYFKDKPFTPGMSDLDIAIVSSGLYARYFDYSLLATNGFSDLTKFVDQETSTRFFALVTKKGMLRPDIGPHGPYKARWNAFFYELSKQYTAHFKDINGAIYISEKAYLTKQTDCIRAVRGELK